MELCDEWGTRISVSDSQVDVARAFTGMNSRLFEEQKQKQEQPQIPRLGSG
jgi:hypothetical protein